MLRKIINIMFKPNLTERVVYAVVRAAALFHDLET